MEVVVDERGRENCCSKAEWEVLGKEGTILGREGEELQRVGLGSC